MNEPRVIPEDDLSAEAIAETNAEAPAYPWGQYVQGGVTKRELFAAMIAGDLAASYAQGGDFMEGHVAEGAVKVADALLKELAK